VRGGAPVTTTFRDLIRDVASLTPTGSAKLGVLNRQFQRGHGWASIRSASGSYAAAAKGRRQAEPAGLFARRLDRVWPAVMSVALRCAMARCGLSRWEAFP
jgi:hypothetical protein